MENITSGSAVHVMTLEEEIANHLEYNASAPIPSIYIAPLVPVCVKAIHEYNKGNWKALIDLPEGLTWTSLTTGIEYPTMPVYEVVRIYNLIHWIKKI